MVVNLTKCLDNVKASWPISNLPILIRPSGNVVRLLIFSFGWKICSREGKLCTVHGQSNVIFPFGAS